MSDSIRFIEFFPACMISMHNFFLLMWDFVEFWCLAQYDFSTYRIMLLKAIFSTYSHGYSYHKRESVFHSIFQNKFLHGKIWRFLKSAFYAPTIQQNGDSTLCTPDSITAHRKISMMLWIERIAGFYKIFSLLFFITCVINRFRGRKTVILQREMHIPSSHSSRNWNKYYKLNGSLY